MQSVMNHTFSRAPTVEAPRSRFDRSFGHKTTFDAGYLIPFYVDDVLPGDTFNLETTAIARLSTPEFPFMDNMYLDTHFFFVPLRLVWDNARKFFGEQTNPGDSISYTLPVMSSYTPVALSLDDYLGLPPVAGQTPVSIYHRGYNLIWNEYFRDQNLQNSAVVDTDDGPDTNTDYVLLRRGKRHDYFTSALTSPQKGTAVSLPLGTIAPVTSTGVTPTFTQGTDTLAMRMSSGSGTVNWPTTPTATGNVAFSATGLEADLSSATAATINDLREAFQTQRLLERDARAGSRYSEIIYSHFSVNFYDISYRPEFLGGGSTRIKASVVASTNTNATASPTQELGDVGAFATGIVSGHGFTKSFVEHGFVMGIVSVRADLTYQQGIHKRFLKSTRYDVYWPSLAFLGEQAIENQEIYYNNDANDTDVFGYQERYAEYRYFPSMITGQFRSSHATPLDAWHLSQEFSSRPALDSTFIVENPPVDRIIRATNEPHFIFDSFTKLICARPMPVFSVPGMIDHF